MPTRREQKYISIHFPWNRQWLDSEFNPFKIHLTLQLSWRMIGIHFHDVFRLLLITINRWYRRLQHFSTRGMIPVITRTDGKLIFYKNMGATRLLVDEDILFFPYSHQRYGTNHRDPYVQFLISLNVIFSTENVPAISGTITELISLIKI